MHQEQKKTEEEKLRRSGVLFRWRKCKKNQEAEVYLILDVIEVSLGLAVEGFFISYDHEHVRSSKDSSLFFLVEVYFGFFFMYRIVLKVKGQCQLISFKSEMW